MTNEQTLEVLRVLAAPRRVEIMQKIRALQSGGEVTCNSVLQQMDIAQSTFAHHIKELIDSGLVHGQPDGRCLNLKVNDAIFDEFNLSLKGLLAQID